MGRTKLLLILVTLNMLSISKLNSGNAFYCLDIATQDYYLNGNGEPSGVWIHTKGTLSLRLSGTVLREDLAPLYKGVPPQGEKKLVQNAGKQNRRPGWDLTFSAPKSVSVLWVVAPPDIQKIIQQCHFLAVVRGLEYMEKEAVFARLGKGGKQLLHAGLVAPSFEHATAREASDSNLGASDILTPHLHTHCPIPNLAECEQGWRALYNDMLYFHKMRGGAVYRAELAKQLRMNLGLQLVRKGFSFEVVGVPQDLCRFLSPRRQEIEKVLRSRFGEKGLKTASAAALVALETRQTKKAIPPRSHLFEQWRKVAAQFGFTPKHVNKLINQTHTLNTPQQPDKFVSEAIGKILQKQACFNKKTLLIEALNASVEHGIDPSDIHKSVDKQLRRRSDIISERHPDNSQTYTTSETAALSKTTAMSIKKLYSTRVASVSAKKLNAVTEHYAEPRNPQQEELKHHLKQIVRAAMKEDTKKLDRSRVTKDAKFVPNNAHLKAIQKLVLNRRRISILKQSKDYSTDWALRISQEAWQKAGFHVIGASLSKAGVSHLEDATGIDSMTLRKLELKMNPTPLYQLKHHARQFKRAAQRRRTYSIDGMKITKDTILVVHEAEKLSAKQMNNLTEAVSKHGGKLVLVQGNSRHRYMHSAFQAIDFQLRQLRQMRGRDSPSLLDRALSSLPRDNSNEHKLKKEYPS